MLDLRAGVQIVARPVSDACCSPSVTALAAAHPHFEQMLNVIVQGGIQSA
jgi:hypothetical protein